MLSNIYDAIRGIGSKAVQFGQEHPLISSAILGAAGSALAGPYYGVGRPGGTLWTAGVTSALVRSSQMKKLNDIAEWARSHPKAGPLEIMDKVKKALGYDIDKETIIKLLPVIRQRALPDLISAVAQGNLGKTVSVANALALPLDKWVTIALEQAEKRLSEEKEAEKRRAVAEIARGYRIKQQAPKVEFKTPKDLLGRYKIALKERPPEEVPMSKREQLAGLAEAGYYDKVAQELVQQPDLQEEFLRALMQARGRKIGQWLTPDETKELIERARREAKARAEGRLQAEQEYEGEDKYKKANEILNTIARALRGALPSQTVIAFEAKLAKAGSQPEQYKVMEQYVGELPESAYTTKAICEQGLRDLRELFGIPEKAKAETKGGEVKYEFIPGKGLVPVGGQ